MYNQLQIREIFHLVFLRWLGHKVATKFYALKGGVNLRFFFNSFRYSEDIDLDVHGIRMEALCDVVMGIFQMKGFQDTFKSFGIEKIIPPDITKAKQTQITQRFKVHLWTFAGEELFTKIEFSRRGLTKGIVVQPVSDSILRLYKLPPLLVPHYNIHSTVMQKVSTIAQRSVIQARDILDLYILSSQYKEVKTSKSEIIDEDKLSKAYENVFEVSFEQFRDTVLFYLAPEEQAIYKSESCWDEVKLKVANFIEELRRGNA